MLCIALITAAAIAGCSKKKEVNYLEWSSADWQEAGDDEKKACAASYTKYMAELTGIEDGADQVENMSDEKLDAVISALDMLFASGGDSTLKEHLGEVQ